MKYPYHKFRKIVQVTGIPRNVSFSVLWVSCVFMHVVRVYQSPYCTSNMISFILVLENSLNLHIKILLELCTSGNSFINPAIDWFLKVELEMDVDSLGRSINFLECNLVFYLSYSIEFAKLPYRRPEMITYQEGDLIAARFPDDGHWYRARVLHVLESEYKVVIS